MKKLAEDIMAEMDDPAYVPVEVEALIVIAYYLKRIGDALASDKGAF